MSKQSNHREQGIPWAARGWRLAGEQWALCSAEPKGVVMQVQWGGTACWARWPWDLGRCGRLHVLLSLHKDCVTLWMSWPCENIHWWLLLLGHVGIPASEIKLREAAGVVSRLVVPILGPLPVCEPSACEVAAMGSEVSGCLQAVWCALLLGSLGNFHLEMRGWLIQGHTGLEAGPEAEVVACKSSPHWLATSCWASRYASR